MDTPIREYDAKMDSQKQIALRTSSFNYYHVSEFKDGRILLEPCEQVPSFQVSANTLTMMDSAVKNMKNGKVSIALDLSEFIE